MLLAVLATAVARHLDSIAAWCAAAGVLVASALSGGLLRRRVRRDGAFQVASAALLALAGIPVEVAGAADARAMALIAAAWCVVFVPCALVVRAAFERARRRESSANRLQAASVSVCTLGAALFLAAGAYPEALASTLAGAVCAAISALRPTVKQMKPVGLSFAGLAAAAAFVLVL
jgi:hypothetical protein